MQKFLEPSRKPKVIYTDNALEFGKACEDLTWNHCTSTPHRSETNGIAERAVRRIKEGTSAVLLQSGLDENWWADSMERYFYLRNILDRLSGWENTIRKAILVNHLKDPSSHLVHWLNIISTSTKDQSRIQQFGKTVLPAIFFGYVLYAGRIWKGDIPIVDFEELEEMDASEIHAQRLNAKEVILPKSGDNCKFPVARWNSTTVWRRSVTENNNLDTESTCSRSTSRRFS